MQPQNKIEFEARPVEIHVNQNRYERAYAEFSLKGNRDATLALSLSDEDMKLMLMKDVDPLCNTYKITIENITKQPTGSELLQMASTSANLGNSKLAVEQAVKALQKLVEQK